MLTLIHWVLDYSFEQLSITALRIETVKHLSYDDFINFWGYPNSSTNMSQDDRLKLLESFDLTEEQKSFLANLINKNPKLIYSGKYEKTLKAFSKVIQKVMGKHINRLKEFKSHDEFSDYYYQEFPIWRWKLLVKSLGNTTLLNALLYKGSHPIKNINRSFSGYFEQVFNALFRFLSPRQSFFLQMLFFGEIIDIDGAPIEADPSIFTKMKKGIEQCEIKFYQGDFFGICNSLETKIDFVSFSDILSYFPDDLGEVYLQKIRNKLSSNAITVHRYYFHITKNMDTTGYEKISNQYLQYINREKTQIYLIDIYQKK